MWGPGERELWREDFPCVMTEILFIRNGQLDRTHFRLSGSAGGY